MRVHPLNRYNEHRHSYGNDMYLSCCCDYHHFSPLVRPIRLVDTPIYDRNRNVAQQLGYTKSSKKKQQTRRFVVVWLGFCIFLYGLPQQSVKQNANETK